MRSPYGSGFSSSCSSWAAASSSGSLSASRSTPCSSSRCATRRKDASGAAGGARRRKNPVECGRGASRSGAADPGRGRGMFGYHGCYLRIDLTDGSARRIPLAEAVLRRFLGGVGLATYLMHREAPPGVEPLSPAAPLIFSLSPLVGTPLTTSAKFAVVAKSPLTDRLNDALSSSHFALAAKRAGCDALVLVGACPGPSVLVVEDGRVRVEPAEDLWGLPGEEAAAA